MNKVTGYKSNTQKSLAFLYANDEKSEREIKEAISFIIAKKRIKYLRINLTKETKYLYTENYKTLIKEIKDDIDRWKTIPCSWIGRTNIVKMSILPTAIYKFNAIPIKLSIVIFHRTRTTTKKNYYLYGNTKGPQIANTILAKKKEARGINLPDFKLFLIVTVITTVWYCHKNRIID